MTNFEKIKEMDVPQLAGFLSYFGADMSIEMLENWLEEDDGRGKKFCGKCAYGEIIETNRINDKPVYRVLCKKKAEEKSRKIYYPTYGIACKGFDWSDEYKNMEGVVNGN